MTGRVLVWPWHGKLQGGQIQLSDGSSRPHVQPPNSEVALGLAGPGDTHHILVSGVDPISPVETAQAPPGGEWWAGQALLSGSMLYGQPLDGWIYQGPDDSRWWVKIQNVAVGTSSTSGTFRVRRFGVVGAPRKSEAWLLRWAPGGALRRMPPASAPTWAAPRWVTCACMR